VSLSNKLKQAQTRKGGRFIMQRKNYDAAFKGRLALELAKELRTVNIHL